MAGTPRSGALVGYGVIGEGHADGYERQSELEIVAVVDASAGRREAGQRRFPMAKSYSSIAEAIDREPLDFIDICTPPSFHSEHIGLGLRHDLFVICEKPLLLSSTEASDIMSLLRQTRGRLHPAHNYGFAPAVQRLLGVGHDEIGVLQRARFSTQRTGHARGTDGWNPDWRRDPSISGGGILQDHGPHSVYLACRAARSNPTAVSCRLQRPDRGVYRHTEDEARLLLEFDSLLVEIELSWCADRRTTRYELTGTAGTVALDGDRLEVTRASGTTSELIPSDFDDPRHGRWFAALLAEASSTMASAEMSTDLLTEAMVTISVIEAAYQSAAEGGRRVELEP
jgi:predicted dehydrogenase